VPNRPIIDYGDGGTNKFITPMYYNPLLDKMQPGITGSLDAATLDAFGRLRISQPHVIFDSKQLIDNRPLYWDDQQTSGTGTTSTYNLGQASTTIAVSASTAGTRVRQTKRRFNYQPGRSQLVLMTGVLGAAVTGVTRRIGLFDDNNGILFELAGAALRFRIRNKTNGSIEYETVEQADWNIDSLDGTGPSGKTIDTSKAQIFLIDYEWLGTGSVRMGFVIDGIFVYCHAFHHANLVDKVYMATPNLPLRYEISNGGSGGAASLVCICASVASEGGREQNGFDISTSRGANPFVTLNDSDVYPIIAVQLRSGCYDAEIDIKSLSMICTTTAAFRWVLYYNPTLTGTALSYTGVPYSAVRAAIGTDNSTKIVSGLVMTEGYGQAQFEGTINSEIKNKVSLGVGITGNPDTIVLGIQRFSSQAETFYASLGWNESV